MEPFLGMIAMFGFNFAPRGWAFCNGQLLPIAQNTALFALLGTTYGGDGRVTFGLPNLQGRTPVGFGQGAGLSNYVLGQVSGTESATLTINNLPAHGHPVTINAAADPGDSSDPTGAYPANTGNLDKEYKSGTVTNKVAMNAGMATAGNTGNTQPFAILQPSLAVNFCIAMEGIFPSRS
ncbi:phage tail protein [Niabella hirudinis]|uniref:phage tail protein n=1 Tax=Niabella hirudinis TaxID=1285929 RepID=UPI003EB733F0